VRRWLKRHGLSLSHSPRKRTSLAVSAELRRLYVDERLTLRAIGGQLGVSRETVRQALEDADIARRDRHDRVPNVNSVFARRADRRDG